MSALRYYLNRCVTTKCAKGYHSSPTCIAAFGIAIHYFFSCPRFSKIEPLITLFIGFMIRRNNCSLDIYSPDKWLEESYT